MTARSTAKCESTAAAVGGCRSSNRCSASLPRGRVAIGVPHLSPPSSLCLPLPHVWRVGAAFPAPAARFQRCRPGPRSVRRFFPPQNPGALRSCAAPMPAGGASCRNTLCAPACAMRPGLRSSSGQCCWRRSWPAVQCLCCLGPRSPRSGPSHRTAVRAMSFDGSSLMQVPWCTTVVSAA